MNNKVAIIGRSELLYNAALLLLENGFKIVLVITSNEAPEYKITSDDFRKLAIANNAMFIKTSKINTDDVLEKIESLGLIDIAISINYSGVIANEVIQKFKLGILNAHGGDLPRYRGNACQAWAIINNEEKVGLCIHKMIGGELDSGDIIERDYFPIELNTRVGEIWKWMDLSIPKMILNAVQKLSLDSKYLLEKQSSDKTLTLRCFPRIPEDGKINWNCDSINIIRLINASSEPYSGAFCYFDNMKIIIWRAFLEICDENILAIPGQISSINSDYSLSVICGSGKIRLTDIEFNNIRSEKPAQFIKTIRKRFI